MPLHKLEIISSLKQQLTNSLLSHTALVGFDGYIDRIYKAVKGRIKQEVDYFPSLTDFGDKIHYASGKSAQIELVPVMTKQGGNAPIMAMALAQLGFDVSCCGTLGDHQIHHVFQELEDQATIHTLGTPALTTALEFEDGKLILSDLSAFEQLDYERLIRGVGEKVLISLFQSAHLIAMVGWSNLPLARDFLESLSKLLLPQLDDSPRHFFFDLADTTRKSQAELLSMLESLNYFTQKATVTLGLNENEALHVYEILYPGKEISDTADLSAQLYQAIAIDQVLVHPIRCSCLATKKDTICLDGRLVPDPKILTGAGDNLNAGFCLGLSMNLPPAYCLVLGMANSGAYISLGHSPDKHELIQYLSTWEQELIISNA